MGVVVRRYIDIFTKIINFPYSTCIRSFFSSSIPTLFFFKMFFGLYIYIYIYIYIHAKVFSIQIVQYFRQIPPRVSTLVPFHLICYQKTFHPKRREVHVHT